VQNTVDKAFPVEWSGFYRNMRKKQKFLLADSQVQVDNVRYPNSAKRDIDVTGVTIRVLDASSNSCRLSRTLTVDRKLATNNYGSLSSEAETDNRAAVKLV
jgi:hypothetical protein